MRDYLISGRIIKDNHLNLTILLSHAFDTLSFLSTIFYPRSVGIGKPWFCEQPCCCIATTWQIIQGTNQSPSGPSPLPKKPFISKGTFYTCKYLSMLRAEFFCILAGFANQLLPTRIHLVVASVDWLQAAIQEKFAIQVDKVLWMENGGCLRWPNI